MRALQICQKVRGILRILALIQHSSEATLGVQICTASRAACCAASGRTSSPTSTAEVEQMSYSDISLISKNRNIENRALCTLPTSVRRCRTRKFQVSLPSAKQLMRMPASLTALNRKGVCVGVSHQFLIVPFLGSGRLAAAAARFAREYSQLSRGRKE
jgi:hypothetical protein